MKAGKRASGTRMGVPGTRSGAFVLPPSTMKVLRQIGGRDVVVVNDDLAKDSVIHYTRGKVACKRCGEPRRADALNEEGVCLSLNVCLRYQQQEVEIMTSTLTVDWKKDNTIPPRNNDEVARIMRDEGVTRRHAYSILRRRSEESVDISTVSEGQRVAVLGTLINDHASRKDVHSLIEELHAIGVKIDGHDVTKTLFALQRQGFVRFRERNQPRTLYAIVVTNAGLDAWAARKPSDSLRSLMAAQEAEASVALDESPEGAHTAKWPMARENEIVETSVITNVGPDQQEQAHEIVQEHATSVARAIANARALQQEVIALGAGPETRNSGEPVDPSDHRPWPQGDLSSWPRFSEIRTRAIRAKKLNQAADLLQEVGGHDDAVLTIMSETEFSDLESEVLDLLTMYGEIE